MIQRSLLRQSRALSSRTTSSTSQPSLRLHSLALRSQPPQLRTRIAARWYSEAAEAKKDADSSAGGDTQAPAAEQSKPAEEDPVRRELDAKSREVIELKDKYLRSVADFRNLQDRTKREVQSARDFALQRFAKDLLDTIDTFDRALTTVAPEKLQPDTNTPPETSQQDLINLHNGLKMTETILMQTLKKHGLERFDPSVEGEGGKGQRFDPNLHEATFMTAQPDKEDGTVFYTQQKGFLLNGRVLRAAKVGVVKNS